MWDRQLAVVHAVAEADARLDSLHKVCFPYRVVRVGSQLLLYRSLCTTVPLTPPCPYPRIYLSWENLRGVDCGWIR